MIPRISPPFDLADFLLYRKGWTNISGVRCFERSFSAWCGKEFAVAFPYCRTAFFALIRVNGWIGKEIILPAYTCSSMPSTVVLSGNVPRFVDIEPGLMTMDMKQVQSAVNRKTAAIVITPMYGYPVRTGPAYFRSIKQSGALVINDCALGLGTSFPDTGLLSGRHISLYSFSIGKQISTGEGGMVVTDDRKVYEELKNYRDSYLSPAGLLHRVRGMLFFISSWIGTSSYFYPVTHFLASGTPLLDSLTKHYDRNRIILPGGAFYQLGSSAGFLGVSQVKKIDSILNKRMRIAESYTKAFKNIDWITSPSPEVSERASYSHFPCRVKNRADFIVYMLSKGIETGTEVFDYVAPNLPVFKKYSNGSYPESEKLSRSVVLFPVHHRLTDRELNRVIEETIKWHP